MKIKQIFAGLICFATLGHTRALCQKAPPEDPEIKMGRDSAAENDKDVKLLTDPVLLERVNRIGQEIAVIANESEVPATWGTAKVKKFTYSFKIVDDKDVNAYSLPGGFIYVHKGLLDYVHSDDELAGVLGHEVAHAAHHHMVKLLKEQAKLQPASLLAIALSAAFSRGQSDAPAKIALGAQLFATAKLNTMGIEAERDADQAGIRYLQKTKYNPVGLLTFMERLARDEQKGPERILGIYRTHPPSPERAKSAIAMLETLGIAIARRETDPFLRAVAIPSSLKGFDGVDIRMYGTLVARLSPLGGLSAMERGRRVVEAINKLFDQGLQSYELRMSMDKSRILARTMTLISFEKIDSDTQKLPMAELTVAARKAIETALWQDQFNRPVASIGIGR